jgi:putative sigma-54 modulation protein
MKIDIFAKNLELTDPIRVFIDDKIGGLTKHFKSTESIKIKVEIARTTKHHRSGDVYYAEANLNIDGKLLRANATNADVRTAITEVKDSLQAEIKKMKEKRKDLARQPKE